MAISFPLNPNNGDTYSYGGKVYVYNSTTTLWTIQSSTSVVGLTADSISENLVPSANVTYDLGAADKRWRDLYLSGNTLHLGTTSLSVSSEGALTTTVGGQTVTVGGALETYANVSLLPVSGNEDGDQAYVTDNNRLYVWNTNGWYSIALLNQSPTFLNIPNTSIELLNTDPYPLDMSVSDPEGFPVTLSYTVTSGNGVNRASIDIASNNSVTVTGGNTGGSFTATFSATDGINITTAPVVIIRNTFAVSGGIVESYEINGVQYKSHTFLEDGTFYLPTTAFSKALDILVVGGGGGGGYGAGGEGGGGGGGGGVIIRPALTWSQGGVFNVIIGQGGTGGTSTGGDGTKGQTTYFTHDPQDGSSDSYTLMAIGGGIGDGGGDGGGAGGSGGGARGASSDKAGGASEQPTQTFDSGTYGYGNAAGTGAHYYSGSGGGGAGASSVNSNINADGGAGIVCNYRYGTDVYYGGGGGGTAGRDTPSSGFKNGMGGIGGGGNAANTGILSTSGTPNSGGGGGSVGSGYQGKIGTGTGGSGIVVLRYAL